MAGKATDEKDLEAAREARRRHVAVARQILAMEPDSMEAQRDLALALKYHGSVLHRLDEPALARAEYDQAVALDRKGVAAEPLSPKYRLDLSFSLASVGSLLRDQKDLRGALAAYREAYALRHAVYAADPGDEFAYTAVVRAHKSLAEVFRRMGNVGEAAREE